MAVIDTFLKLMVTQRAEKLVLVPEEVPTLVSEGATSELPMPAVPADLSCRLALELAGDQIDEAGDEAHEGNYLTAEGEKFSYEVHANGTGFRIEMTPLGSPGEDDDHSEAPISFAPPESTKIDPAGSAPATADARPAQPDPAVLAVLDEAQRADASDLFLSAGKPARMRLDGVIMPLDTGPFTDAQIRALIIDDAHRRDLEEMGSTDFGARWELSRGPHRFRVNLFRHSGGLAAAIRPVRERIRSLDELHLPSDLLDFCRYPSGLVLVTGASGSGKSSTLAALVDHINQSMARHIITIEDPIEFVHREQKSLLHQREVGTDLESFSTGLRAALRENPDVILLGEMRDLPTVSAALTAAETGHLVLSTLHTGNATAAVNRIIDVFPGHQQAHVRVQLSTSLRAVVAQRLLPSKGSGRLPAIEKLIVTPAVANAIRDGHEHHMQSAIQTGAQEGMITLERSLAALVQRKKITPDTALRHAADTQALRKLLD